MISRWNKNDTNEVTKVGLRDVRLISTTLGAVDVLPLGTYDGLDIVCLRVPTYGRTNIKLEGLLLGF